MLKDDGRVSNKDKKNKQHKKYRDVKCSNRDCRAILNIDEMVENHDYDILPDGSYVFYCSCCDNSEVKKL
jgi:hypothetical protein